MQKKDKIIGITLFSVLTCVVVFLSFFQTKNSSTENIKKVAVEGNILLTETEYLKVTGLHSIDANDSLSLIGIKQLFEKHPYIEKVSVELKADYSVSVKVNEKKIEALLNVSGTIYLLTNEYIVLPILANTSILDYPVITNSSIKNVSKMDKLNTEEIKTAFRIIDISNNLNSDFSNRLSEINLRTGKEVVLYLSGFELPILLGKESEVKKLFTLNSLLKQNIEVTSVIKSSSYIDLRYDNSVFLGRGLETGI